MTIKERITEYLKNHPDGVDDDILAEALNLRARQQANSRCRQLEKEDLVVRRKVRGKIHNFWVGGQKSWPSKPVFVEPREEQSGTEDWLYYSGCNLQHGGNLYSTECSIGLVKAVHNRLASLNGSGVVLTKNLEEEGSTLHLNYDARMGSLRVELLRDGVTIPGYEAEICDLLTGDSLDQVVSWTGNNSLPEIPFRSRSTWKIACSSLS